MLSPQQYDLRAYEAERDEFEQWTPAASDCGTQCCPPPQIEGQP